MTIEEKKQAAWSKGRPVPQYAGKYYTCEYDEASGRIEFDKPHSHKILEARYVDAPNNALGGYVFLVEKRGLIFFGDGSTRKTISRYVTDMPVEGKKLV